MKETTQLRNLLGQTLGHYRLDQWLGHSKVGSVFKAFDLSQHCDVALKVITLHLSSNPNIQAELERHIQQVAQIAHPGLVKIMDLGATSEILYLVMPLLSGDNLWQMLRELHAKQRWMPLSDAVAIVRQLSLAVHQAHQHGIVGFDVRPKQLMFLTGENVETADDLPYQVVLTDLGLTPLLYQQASHIPTALLSYLAPEQIFDQSIDGRSDVYALGVLLYILAVKVPPHHFKHLSEVIAHYQAALSIPNLPADLPAPITDILLKALAYKPDDRFPTVEAFTQSLAEYGKPVSSELPPNPAFQIQVEPSQFSVVPGQQVTATVSVDSESEITEIIRLWVEGIPATWLQPATLLLEKESGIPQIVKIAICPPLTPQTRAGRHRIAIKAARQRQPNQVAEVARTLTISAYSQFQATLWPDHLDVGQRGQLMVENQGNIPQNYGITFASEQNALSFNPPEAQLRVEAGQSVALEFQVELQKLRLIGGEWHHPFTIQVASANSPSQTFKSNAISKGVAPVWLLTVCLFACLLILISGAFAFNFRQMQVAAITETAFALVEAPKATQTTRALQKLATVEAATATADYLNRDDDRDGLTNGTELDRNTLLNKRDTDEDGLDDGNEVERGTNPLKADTDGDGLKDGFEVSQGINPLKPDTDGDGTLDAADPAPGRTPTETPSPTATPTPINIPPTILIQEPIGGSTYVAPAEIMLITMPNDADGTIARVDFFAGPALLGAVQQSPYQLLWQDVEAGNYRLTAVAVDDDGAIATSAVVDVLVSEPANMPPKISIAEPLAGSIIEAGSNLTIAALATDDDGRIVEVQFYANTTWLDSTHSRRTRYEYVWHNLVPGEYALSAVAVDDDGATSIAVPVKITVSQPDNIPPTIDLISPENETIFAPNEIIPLEAIAQDVDGAVIRVDFYANGLSLGSSTTPPYTLTWSSAVVGPVIFTADATDNAGATRISNAVSINIREEDK